MKRYVLITTKLVQEELRNRSINNESIDSTLRRLLDLPLNQHRVAGVVRKPKTPKSIDPLRFRKSKYPFDDMKVGEEMTIPWKRDDNGKPVNGRGLNQAIGRTCKVTGARFESEGRLSGFYVKRIA